MQSFDDDRNIAEPVLYICPIQRTPAGSSRESIVTSQVLDTSETRENLTDMCNDHVVAETASTGTEQEKRDRREEDGEQTESISISMTPLLNLNNFIK